MFRKLTHWLGLTRKARWGIVSTVKAPVDDLAKFLAHHLDLGASEIHIFLDDDNPEALAAFGNTDRVILHETRKGFWKGIKGYRPKRHQTRQAWAADWLYHQKPDLDWITHIDVDEFLVAQGDIGRILGQVKPSEFLLQMRASEAMVVEDATSLDPKTTYAKAYRKHRPRENLIYDDLYPDFWRYLQSGFMSHMQGKYFLRTNALPCRLDIHVVFRNNKTLKPSRDMDRIELCHMHYPSRERWLERFDYRLSKGSYREELPPAMKEHDFGLNLHHLFNTLIEAEGRDGLHRFFDQVCLASPELISALDSHGLLKKYQLGLDAKRDRYFPNLLAADGQGN